MSLWLILVNTHTDGLFTGRSGMVMGVAVTADEQPAITSHTQDTLSLARTDTYT